MVLQRLARTTILLAVRNWCLRFYIAFRLMLLNAVNLDTIYTSYVFARNSTLRALLLKSLCSNGVGKMLYDSGCCPLEHCSLKYGFNSYRIAKLIEKRRTLSSLNFDAYDLHGILHNNK